MLMDFLFRKTNICHLAFIRILIGSWFFIDMVSMLFSGYVKRAYVEPEFNFPFYGFEWIKPLPEYVMYGLFVILIGLSICITIGYRMKPALWLFILGFGYVFMCDIVYTLNKFYLFLIFAFVLVFTDADRGVSKSQKPELQYVPYWQVLVFQSFLVLIYTYSGISKINPDWLIHAEPMMIFLRHTLPFKHLSEESFQYVAYWFTYCGILFDLNIGWMLFNKRTRKIGLLLQATFHTINFLLLGVGSLSIFTALFTWLLFPSPWLERKLNISNPDHEIIEVSHQKKTWTTALLAAFFLIHILIPHRHYLTGNNVNWTEKGHRFSWRLMTRAKSGSRTVFYVQSDQLKKKKTILPRKILTARQYRKMSAETDLIIAFAHYLQSKYYEEGHTNIKVTVDAQVKLNGRVPSPIIPSDLDLSQVSRTFLKDEISLPISKRP